VFYAGESRVHQLNPVYGQRITRMNLSEPEIHSVHAGAWNGVQISTIAADHNVLIAGGFHGEYGMIPLDRPNAKHSEGIIVDHLNSITNHIQIQLSRSSGLPQAAIASNDCGVRLLDCTTNGFIAHHEYDQAINCTALSPDHRLRVLVGDTKNVMICNAESGEIVQELNGHVDYGFACAWADNGWHVATGNQDMLIKIWDARMWTDSNGDGKVLSTISATKAGVRCLKFSPLGGGKRVLLAAEPADFLSIIDAESYASKQRLDFFGEIAGTDFSPDGQNIYVGIHDSWRGGIMEFEKCGFGSLYKQDMKPATGEELYNTEVHHKRMAAGLDWKRTIDEVVQDSRSMRTITHHRRRAANLGDLDL
jgi:WD40 repeat protein